MHPANSSHSLTQQFCCPRCRRPVYSQCCRWCPRLNHHSFRLERALAPHTCTQTLVGALLSTACTFLPLPRAELGLSGIPVAICPPTRSQPFINHSRPVPLPSDTVIVNAGHSPTLVPEPFVLLTSLPDLNPSIPHNRCGVNA